MGKKKQIWVVGMWCMIPCMGIAWQTDPLTGSHRLFDEGKELFMRGNYAAAQQALQQYAEVASCVTFAEETDYMLACTSYELDEPDCLGRLQDFLHAYPESRHANRVRALIASACFYDRNYDEAIRYFETCGIEKLADSERDACIMRLATAYLNVGNLKEAGLWFTVLKDVSGNYYMDAIFQLAYIDYVELRYDKAFDGFRLAASDAKYASLSLYYIADIYLRKQDYIRANEMADLYLDTYPQQEHVVQMKRIQGEALYGLQRYTEAADILAGYCGMTGVEAGRDVYYQLGMSHFHIGAYSMAADELGKAANADDTLAQHACLHRGLAYLQLKDRRRARMAFEQASIMAHDRSVQEQALYNYALCVHETSYSPFAESVTVFERFLNEFPNSTYTEKVNGYLVETYLNTRSYQAALQSIAKIVHPSDRILEAKQKLLFRMGTQAFAQAAFEDAVDYFSQSIRLGRYDAQTQADACYWRGESKYRMEQYTQAALDYRLYLEYTPSREKEEYGLALYNLGYVAFKQKQYDEALEWFTRCTQSPMQNRTVLADVYNRIGDCNFHARRFDVAVDQYAQAFSIDPSLGDYSLFQEGFVKGLLRDYTGKIQVLNRLLTNYPSSQYVDDALYEQGRAFVQQEDNARAIERYTILVERFPDSPLSRRASGEIGLLYYQDDKYPEAVVAYKKVISAYPGSEEARLALRDLKSIYIDLNQVDDYLAFVSSLPGRTHFDVNERDSLTYVAAERMYMRGGIAEAESGFIRYLQNFPQGSFSMNAAYYLGTIAYGRKNYEEASRYLGQVLAYPDNKFSGEAMDICASIAYINKEYDKAFGLYLRLADCTESPQRRVEVLQHALECADLSDMPSEVVQVASALLAQSKLDPEVQNRAYYLRAKASITNGQVENAITDLDVLAKDTRNLYGAEAKYLLAQLYFDRGETDKAEQEVLEYIDVSTPHAYWLARSFVLLSDIYVRSGRDLDAKQYLLSLKQNYQADDDISEMIETRLAGLNKKE